MTHLALLCPSQECSHECSKKYCR